MIGLSRIYIVIIVVAVYFVVGLAIYKVIKSKLPDLVKVFWILAFIVLNILAAIPFIIFNDYILTKEKRAN